MKLYLLKNKYWSFPILRSILSRANNIPKDARFWEGDKAPSNIKPLKKHQISLSTGQAGMNEN